MPDSTLPDSSLPNSTFPDSTLPDSSLHDSTFLDSPLPDKQSLIRHCLIRHCLICHCLIRHCLVRQCLVRYCLVWHCLIRRFSVTMYQGLNPRLSCKSAASLIKQRTRRLTKTWQASYLLKAPWIIQQWTRSEQERKPADAFFCYHQENLKIAKI